MHRFFGQRITALDGEYRRIARDLHAGWDKASLRPKSMCSRTLDRGNWHKPEQN
jgi:hypothetical protein